MKVEEKINLELLPLSIVTIIGVERGAYFVEIYLYYWWNYPTSHYIPCFIFEMDQYRKQRLYGKDAT